MKRVRHSAFVIGLLAFAALGAACGGGSESTPAAGGSPPSAAPATSAPAAPATKTSALVLEDNEFVPSKFSLKAGSKITLRNEGQALHNFSVEGQDISHDVQPGETETEDVELSPGTYQIFCEYHRGAGMTGTLTVEG